MPTNEKYNQNTMTTGALNHAKSKGFYGSRLDVLRCLCFFSDYKKPEVQLTQAFIAKDIVRDRTTVRRAIRELREAKIIIPIKFPRGGAGQNCATVMKIIWQSEGEETSAVAPRTDKEKDMTPEELEQHRREIDRYMIKLGHEPTYYPRSDYEKPKKEKKQ